MKNENFLRKHSILIVDDDEALLELLKSAFECTDVEVYTANSVAKGIEAVESLPISLVLLDWTFRPPLVGAMPGGDHFQGKPVLDKCLEKDPLLPVVVMSCYAVIDVAEIALASGAASFLTKPLKLNAAISNIHGLLKRYEAAKTRFRALSIEEVKPLEDVEREYVRSVVELCGGNLSKAAEMLGSTRQTMGKIIKSDDSVGNRS